MPFKGGDRPRLGWRAKRWFVSPAKRTRRSQHEDVYRVIRVRHPSLLIRLIAHGWPLPICLPEWLGRHQKMPSIFGHVGMDTTHVKSGSIHSFVYQRCWYPCWSHILKRHRFLIQIVCDRNVAKSNISPKATIKTRFTTKSLTSICSFTSAHHAKTLISETTAKYRESRANSTSIYQNTVHFLLLWGFNNFHMQIFT